jgi:hypothetical protein
MKKAVGYGESNLEAAFIIASDPEKYAGLPLEWARLFLSRHHAEQSKPTRAPRKRSAQGEPGGPARKVFRAAAVAGALARPPVHNSQLRGR